MQKTNQNSSVSKGTFGTAKIVHAQNGGTRGHSKPGTGSTHAGPPPPPQPQAPKK
jgi:hypothetical protein